MAYYSLAGSTFEGTVALVALFTVGFSFCRTLAVADEVQNYLHLFGEAQRFNFNHLRFAMCWTLLGLNGNLEKHLDKRRGVFRNKMGLADCSM